MNSEILLNKRSWKNIIKIFFPYILTVGILQLIVANLLGLNINNGIPNNYTSWQRLFMDLAGFLGTVFIIWLFNKYIDKMPFKSLGFRNKNLKEDLFYGFSFGFGIMLTGFFLLKSTSELFITGYTLSLNEVILNLSIFLFVAITEEILFRGYVLQNLLASMNQYYALFFSSLLFSLMHIGNPSISYLPLINLFLAGILLGMSYILTKNLWLPIALHLSWNFFQGTVFGFNVSGIKSFTVIKIQYHESNIWNGGSFGFEGSVTCILLQLIGICILYLIIRNRKKNSISYN